MPHPTPVLREMRSTDVPAVMAVQEPASIAGLSGVFPQDEFPFPRDVLADRWLAEIAEPDTGERRSGPMPPHAEQLILEKPLQPR